jgi:hypothetical protein
MKKLILLFTITCAASQMYGMETENIGGLPKEIQNQITQTAIASSKNLNETVVMIKRLSTSFGISYDKLFDNIKDFTKLVHMLADKFDASTNSVAMLFGTPIAKEYSNLGENLLDKVLFSYDIGSLIKQGADINFTTYRKIGREQKGGRVTPLIYAVSNDYAKKIKALLDSGANPNYKSPQFGIALDVTTVDTPESVKTLLKEAMQK